MTPDPYAYLQPFVVWDNAFTPAELDAIEALGDSLPLEQASLAYTTGEGTRDDTVRITRTAWMARNPATAWIYERMERVIRGLNAQTFQFELSGFSDQFQYTVYDGEEGAHFGWHVDQIRQAAHRKLSFSLQLTESSRYEGCDLEIYGGARSVAVPRTRGALVAFPAYRLHRVTPILSGIRKALVAWTAGPPFR